MSKHTPGPWRVVGVDGYATGIWGPSAEDVVPACAPMLQEDARLIAAAPDLLEALEAVLENPKHYATGPGQSMLRAALKKAKGEL